MNSSPDSVVERMTDDAKKRASRNPSKSQGAKKSSPPPPTNPTPQPPVEATPAPSAAPKNQARRKAAPPAPEVSEPPPPPPPPPPEPPAPILEDPLSSSSNNANRRRKGPKNPPENAVALPSDEELAVLLHRPRQRSDCPTFRPCPFVSCRYHLYLDVTRRGRLRINFPEKDLDDLEVTCALDVAEEGPKTLEEIGRIMGGISRERVRQIEQAALNALRSQGGSVLVEFVSERTAEMQLDQNRLAPPPSPQPPAPPPKALPASPTKTLPAPSEPSPKFVARRKSQDDPHPPS